jgi:hypothetical protein
MSSSSGAASSSSAAASSSGGPTDFLGQCNGAHTIVTGVTYAPNAHDPIPRVRVYIPSMGIHPFPTLYCDQCSTPIDPAWTQAISAPDGSFTLNLDAVPYTGNAVDFAIQIGRFRHHEPLTVTPCTTNNLSLAPNAASQTILPGATIPNDVSDVPKIAVSSGPKDHLDAVLAALGITEYDCYEGVPGATHCNKPALNGQYIADLLANPNTTTLSSYNMMFLSCAPGSYKNFLSNHNQATMTMNTQGWVVNNYGRLFATDTAYDYIAQPFPAPITWQTVAGPPPAEDGAIVGCSPNGPPPQNLPGPSVNYTVTVDDPVMAKWLEVGVHVLPTPPPSPPTVPILGFYNKWAAMASLAPMTKKIADGTVPLDLVDTPATMCNGNVTMQDVPLTAEYAVPNCGRVIFSSYHTDAGALGNSPQQRIMEYLIFEAAYCTM